MRFALSLPTVPPPLQKKTIYIQILILPLIVKSNGSKYLWIDIIDFLSPKKVLSILSWFLIDRLNYRNTNYIYIARDDLHVALFRNLPDMNWFSVANFRDQALCTPVFNYN